jgi:hypothetical protein
MIPYRLTMLRWRLARFIAPGPVVAAPLGDAKAYIFVRDGHFASWIETSSIKVDVGNQVLPLRGDAMALATAFGPKGTFSGTIGEAS